MTTIDKNVRNILCVLSALLCFSVNTMAAIGDLIISNNIGYVVTSSNEVSVTALYVADGDFPYDKDDTYYYYSGKITIPENITEAGKEYTVTGIDDWAFAYCNIEELNLPSTITKIGESAFQESYTKNKLKFSTITEIGTCAFFKFMSIDNISLSCPVVARQAFQRSSLKTINLQNTTKIDEQAFYGCEYLKSVELPSTTKTIGVRAFMNCLALENVNIPNGVEAILEGTFQTCSSLKKIVIPASVKSIDIYAFFGSINVEYVQVKSMTPPTLAEAFNAAVYEKTLYIPTGTTETYKAAAGWNKFFESGASISDKAAAEVNVLSYPSTGGNVDGGAIYKGGDVVKITAMPEEIYDFKEWEYDETLGIVAAKDGNVLTFYMPEDLAKQLMDSERSIDITAIFALKQFELTIDVVNEDGQSVDWGEIILGENGKYDINTIQGIAVQAKTGYEFVNLTDENGIEISDKAAVNVTMSEAKTVKAVFKEKQAYTVSLSIDGEGFGHVTGLKTSGRYLEGQDLDLTAIATTATESSTLNCHFVGWTVDGEDHGSDEELQIAEVTKNHVIVAKFEEDAKSALNLAKEGEGTVTFVNEKYTGTSVELYVGKTTAISAIPADHYTFTKWIASDNTEITSNPYVVSFGAEDVTYTAVFTEDAKNNLIVKSNIPEASDLVETTHEGLYKNETKTLSFTETTGYEFVRWDVEYANNAPSAASTDKTQTVTMGECDVTYTAIFQLKEYSITTSGNNCQITVNVNDEESNKATMNSDVDVIVNVAAGYKVKTITKNSQLIELEDGRYSFEMPTENLTFEVVCEPIEYIVSASNVINGNVTFSKNTAIVGEVIEISTAPEDGYIVGSITSEQVAISDNKFVMPSENVTINVTFVVDCERCQNAAQIKSVVDWILVVNKKAIESGDNTEVFDKAYDDLQDKDVEWYKVNGEKDDWCTGKQEEIGGVDERMAIGLYFTQDANSLIGTGDYYAVVTLRGTRCKCITSDIISYSSRSNKMIVTPTSAHQGQTMTISGLPEANAVVRITDVNGAVVKSFNTNGNETMTFEADNSNGIYVVSVIVEDVVKSVRYIVK